MADFDSIINVEEWISDYYLTTDDKGESFGKRVAEAFKGWKQEEKDGLPPSTRLTSRREEIQTALSSLSTETVDDTLHTAYDLISSAFGYPRPGTHTVARGQAELAFEGAADSQFTAVILRARPIGAIEDVASAQLLPLENDNLPTLDGKPTGYTASKLIGELFLADNAPNFVVTLAGNWVILAERETWPLGRYLAVDLGLAIERNDRKAKGEIQRVTAILAMEHLQRGADGTTWWLDTLEQARDHSVKVSEELRGAIKQSIEIIGNDVLERHRSQEKPVAELNGAELGNQALRYLYRILFLLFAEASPELQILPTGDNDYDEGYGLSRLRDQILTEPATVKAQNGTHLYESLQLLFNLVNQGHDPADPQQAAPSFDVNALDDGLQFRELDADLFSRAQTSYIDEVKLSNLALHKVLQNLLLTKEKRGSDRGFISYATLGVAELGQVYEGLMSYTGFIAEEDLIEVAKHGDASKGSWVVPEARAATLPEDSVVYETMETELGLCEQPRRHRRGSFVFRQSSRDRERSASFYSPPVITEFTVGQAIEELEATGRISRADDILTLSICEPAMGSGAFAVEAVNQLAELYLRKKQDELSVEIPGDERSAQLQKVKAHIALHQVYGVDLNKTAVELAEISLWLNTMTPELKAPWFGLRLRHGNSLVGASRATFSMKDLSTKAYLSTEPTRHPLTSMAEAIDAHARDATAAGRVHHFLVPSSGWGSAAEAKDLKDLLPHEIKVMKNWRRQVAKALSKTQQKRVGDLARQVERLWELSLVRLRLAEDQVRRDLDLFGQDNTPTASNVLRSDIEEHLFDNPNSAYQRLRLAMNLWNALWYWPVTEADQLPDYDAYLDALEDILGTPDKKKRPENQVQFGFDMRWDELNATEEIEAFASNQKRMERVLEDHPWVTTAIKVADEQAFFHWDLDFATVMSKGGFDFQVGNPPWVRPDVNVDELLAEHDPWFKLAHKPSQASVRERRQLLAENDDVIQTLAQGVGESVALATVLGDATRFPHLKDQRPDLYRGFMERTWANASSDGIVSLIHPESHFTEKKAAPLRAGAYLRLRRHAHFQNQLKLFDIGGTRFFGVHIYGTPRTDPHYLNASNMYHPSTFVNSLIHNGDGPLPGFKDDDHNWDLRPHKDRVQIVDTDTLEVWRSILEDPGTPLLETRTVYSVNTEAANVLAKLAEAPRIKELGLQFSVGWNETTDKKKGYFDSSWQHPDSWDDVILQGPHLGVSTPIIKQPHPSMLNKQDWSEIDLEAISVNFIPATAYAVNWEQDGVRSSYGFWDSNAKRVPVSEQFRVAWRRMADIAGFRTMYPALIPSGSKHVNPVNSAGSPDRTPVLASAGALLSSVLADFVIRSRGGADILSSTVEMVPFPLGCPIESDMRSTFLRLNCLTEAYAPLWEEITGETWTVDTPLRNAKERWHAQNEIDAMVALSLGVTIDELLMIYRTQFPVMYRYDRENLYDANGRKVPKDVLKLEKTLKDDEQLSESQRTWTHPQSGATYVFEYPFAPLDREADLRASYEKYSAMLHGQQ
ncbi:Eco57I restriction-modification methylase domain-containing protein [Corynebacterium sanguinis]|uniref:Eco57I restriction-modification methylase domain-containing protein n=1 Tax=Corynebacterium sanguinis TaxID=2594913 RepID=UPI0021A2742F|nr:DNA methyltransferase [Corynebacterium sanguinis]MCT1463184.1 class I SAM-dependent DNA methyltransferase [Corynebacterium sanguinis]MCT2329881.1 class I SAM-dependent DNA methyltransferase [Corynebacterium sanguinis]